MRRILSITAIIALISSSLTPLMAATACSGTAKVMSCHGGEMASCDRHAHKNHNAAPADSTPSFSEASIDDSSKCPMDCCAPGQGQSQASVSPFDALPLPLLAQHDFSYVSALFVRVGFSSHTDRGPPSLLS